MAQTATWLADLVLAERCQDGQESATRELFREHQKRVYSTLYRILGRDDELEDLLQETFIQVFRSLPRFRGEARLSTWIDRIAVRCAYRHIGKKRRRDIPVDDPGSHVEGKIELQGGSQQSKLQSREGLRRLYQVMRSLSKDARVAFLLHEVDGRSVADVAEIVGATQTATKVRIWRARKTLLKAAADDPILQDFILNESGSQP